MLRYFVYRLMGTIWKITNVYAKIHQTKKIFNPKCIQTNSNNINKMGGLNFCNWEFFLKKINKFFVFA